MPASEVWLRGEVSLDEMLEDPIVRLVMERDGLDKEAVQSVFLAAAARQTGNSIPHRAPESPSKVDLHQCRRMRLA
jgi:hypothetical protein